MWLIGWEEGEMVAIVWDSGVEHCYSVPEPGHREVGAHDEGTKPDRQQIGENMLNRVGIDWDDASWSCPLVVDLMDVLIELGMMKEPMHKKYWTLKNHVIDSKTTTDVIQSAKYLYWKQDIRYIV